MEIIYVDCVCHSPDHTFGFVNDLQNGDVFLEVYLNSSEPWFKRVLRGFRYVFGLTIPDGHYV